MVYNELVKFIKVISAFLLIFFYLFFSYIRFYNFIGDNNLKSPFQITTFTIENPMFDNQVKYVALGDSLSAGVGCDTIEETFVYSYAKELSEKFGNVSAINMSYPGDTTDKVIANQVPRAIEQQPDYVTLLIGVNDMHNKKTLKQFEQNFTLILNELLTKTNAQIKVINLPYLGSESLVYPPFNFLLKYRTEQFNEVLADLEIIKNNPRLSLTDLYSTTYLLSQQDSLYYSQDLFHPSARGYAAWGDVINAN